MSESQTRIEEDVPGYKVAESYSGCGRTKETSLDLQYDSDIGNHVGCSALSRTNAGISIIGIT